MSPFDHIPAVLGGILAGCLLAYVAFAAVVECITRKVK